MQLRLGDSKAVLASLAENSVDSVVTDPPYGLAFMGKKWDYDVPSVELWKEVFRVLKPGGHVLSFGGTRTYHRMVVNIEDAGFEIRDQIMWIYGSGFPKSHDVSKAIDKAAGAEREVVGQRSDGAGNSGKEFFTGGPKFVGTTEFNITAPSTDLAKQWQGWGTALKPANEPIVLARKPLVGTVAENVEKFGTGGLNIDASRIATDDVLSIGSGRIALDKTGTGFDNYTNPGAQHAQGRWPANILFDEAAAEMLDEQSGQLSQCGGPKKTTHDAGMFGIGTPGRIYKEENRGASRFFYVAKASKRERGEGNSHPTVKPVKLMEYLVRLVTPPGGVVLDPFMGSGTTGVACKNLRFKFVGIERERAYLEIAERRIEFAL